MIVGFAKLPPGQDNTCNACSPPIPDTLYVTLAGLSGDFAQFNGKTEMEWIAGCDWYDVASAGVLDAPYITLRHRVDGANRYWQVHPVAPPSPGSCAKVWRKAGAGYDCTPGGGTYTAQSCVDTDCGDTDSCGDSAGATAVVSLT